MENFQDLKRRTSSRPRSTSSRELDACQNSDFALRCVAQSVIASVRLVGYYKRMIVIWAVRIVATVNVKVVRQTATEIQLGYELSIDVPR